MACAHKNFTDHSTRAADKSLIWTCSHCDSRKKWGPDHGYYGNHECLHCQTAQIDFVWCSEACRKALAEKHRIKPDAPRERKQKAAPKKRVPAWQRKAEAAGWKPPSGGRG